MDNREVFKKQLTISKEEKEKTKDVKRKMDDHERLDYLIRYLHALTNGAGPHMEILEIKKEINKYLELGVKS